MKVNKNKCNCHLSSATKQEEVNKKNKRSSILYPAGGAGGGWKELIPSIVLILMPKCPVCFAGYIALVSGVGLSITTAAYIRIGLIILCIISLLYLATKRLLSLRKEQ